MPKEKFITPKFKGCVNAYTSNKDGSLDIHLELDKPCPPVSDKYGNFFLRIEKDDVDRLMYAGIDALKKEFNNR